MVEERYVEPDDRRGLYRASIVLVALGVALFIATLISVVQADGLSAADGPVRDWLLGLRSQTLTVVMIFLAVVFGPVALPIIVLVVVAAWGFAAKHAWRPIVLASAMLTGVIISQIILQIVRRGKSGTAFGCGLDAGSGWGTSRRGLSQPNHRYEHIYNTTGKASRSTTVHRYHIPRVSPLPETGSCLLDSTPPSRD